MVLSMKKLGENQVASFLADQHGENCHKGSEVHKTTPNDYLSKDQKSKIGKGDAHASNVDVQKGRPMSPGTLALLCDEKDMLSTPDAPSDGSVNLQTVRENQTTSFLASRDGENCHKGSEVHKTTPNDCLRWDQESKNGKGDTHPGDADVQEGRPMSPRTLALLCDEKDMLFTPDASL